VPDEGLGLLLVRGDEVRLGLDGEAERLAFRVDDREQLGPVEVADELAVEAGVDPRGSEPATTTNSAPWARYASFSRRIASSSSLTSGPHSLISV
jgi:hypothetical protein